MAPKLHILSVCVKQSTYQSRIFTSLHAKHSVTTDTGPDPGWDSARISPEEYSLQARVTVFNVGFCPFNALILSIVLEFSQLPIHRVSEGHVTLPHPLLAKHPAFSPPPFSLCFYPIFSAHMRAIWQYTLILSLPPSLFVSLAYSPLDSPLPSVNREGIVSLQILSVLSVGCFVCGNHHDGLKSLQYLQCSQVDAPTHSHLHSQKSKGI